MKETLRKQLSKTGGTEFSLNKLSINLSEMYFLPTATINSLRREVLGKLLTEREKNRLKFTFSIIPNNCLFPEKELTYLANVINKKAATFYNRHGVTNIAPGAETGMDMHNNTLMTTRYCIRYQLGICLKEENRSKIPEPLTLVDEQANRFGLNFNCARCEMDVIFKQS